MNIERFHNQLALSLGYERIINNKRIAIKVDYKNPNDPRIALILPEGTSVGFCASEEPSEVYARVLESDLNMLDMIKQDVEDIINASHRAYINANNTLI